VVWESEPWCSDTHWYVPEPGLDHEASLGLEVPYTPGTIT
jgi:hypothetical protein